MRRFIAICIIIFVWVDLSAQTKYDIRSRLGKNNGAILDERIEELRRNGLQEENLQTLHIYIMQVTNQLLSVKDFKEGKFFYFMEPCFYRIKNSGKEIDYLTTMSLLIREDGEIVSLADARQLYPYMRPSEVDSYLAGQFIQGKLDCAFILSNYSFDVVCVYQQEMSVVSGSGDEVKIEKWEEYVSRELESKIHGPGLFTEPSIDVRINAPKPSYPFFGDIIGGLINMKRYNEKY